MAASDDSLPLQKTPLHALHVELGARMVPFAGYSMPVQYPAGLMAEHKHTRTAAGLFDISHMGQLRLVGPNAAAAFETLMPVDVIDLAAGKQRYGLLLNDAGGNVSAGWRGKQLDAPDAAGQVGRKLVRRGTHHDCLGELQRASGDQPRPVETSAVLAIRNELGDDDNLAHRLGCCPQTRLRM